MSKYTIEVYSLLKDNNFKMFDFDYSFYTDNQIIKSNFENKFLDTYMFHEIGQETVIRFKHYLKTKLNNIMPYYKQLYETELRCQDIDFMLNKDLTETFERTNTSDKQGQSNNNSTTNITNKDVSSLTSNSTTDISNKDVSSLTSNSATDITNKDVSTLTNSTNENSKESNIEQGLASLSTDDKLTSVSSTNNELSQNNTTDTTGKTTNTGSQNNTTDTTGKTTNTGSQNNTTDTTGKNVSQGTTVINESVSDKEVTKLISQGNIGVTSSAELLDKWRKVIINIDNLIIEECSSLFMQVY